MKRIPPYPSIRTAHAAHGEPARTAQPRGPPVKIPRPKLLKQFQGPGYCELCGLYAAVREPHHLWRKGHGGGGTLDIRINLISLGGSCLLPSGRRRFSCFCHDRIHNGKIAPAHVLAIVAAREGTTPETITEVMDLFRRLIRPSPADLRAGLAELSPSAEQLARRELTEAGILEAA